MSDNPLIGLSKALDQDKKRERDTRKKWEDGPEHETAGTQKRRPHRRSHLSKGCAGCRPMCERCIKLPKKKMVKPRPALGQEGGDSDYDSFVEETPSEPDYTYTFDKPRGPHEGSQILEGALAKAVNQYETKATEKLVRAEYEVVGIEKGDVKPITDDDFELV